jgi:hypothetical protein
MLNLFDRCYRKGDPKMMHVRQILFLAIAVAQELLISTAPKPYSNLMEEHHVYKFT